MAPSRGVCVTVEGDSQLSRTQEVAEADWFIDELRHAKRRPVLINFCSWRQLRPLARRLYAMLQATSRAEHDPDRLYIWLAPVARIDGKAVGGSRAFTFGFTTPRLDKIAARIRVAIAELREVDERYDGYGRQTTHGNTDYPAFTVRVRGPCAGGHIYLRPV
jgi:hypothetical protein